MAILLFGWVCEAYLCPANAIFPSLELIQTLSREFERGPVYVSYTVLSRRRLDILTTWGSPFSAAQSMSQSKNGSQSFRAPQCKEGLQQKDARPSSSACSLWS